MATVKQYAAWAEQRIAGIVLREGLACGLVRVVQGPLVLTYTVRLLVPSPASLRKVLSIGPALAQALQVENVRISDTAAGVQIEIPSPVKRTPREPVSLPGTQEGCAWPWASTRSGSR